MIKKLFLSVVFFCFTLWVQAKDYADYVSPLVGTQSSFELSTGNTYPATARPWGMNFWTPERWVTDGNTSILPTRFAVLSRLTSPVRGLTITVSFL